MNDKQRKKPPKVGAIITYRFQELTRDGVPRYVVPKCNNGASVHLPYLRFPSYIGEAIDKTEAKDAEIPEHRKAGAKPAAE